MIDDECDEKAVASSIDTRATVRRKSFCMAHISNLITLEWSWGVAAPAVGYDIDEKLGGEDCDQLRIRGSFIDTARRRPPACAELAPRASPVCGKWQPFDPLGPINL